MFETLNQLNPFSTPDPEAIKKQTIASYRKQLLEHEHAAIYQQKMAEYYKECIRRMETQATQQ